LLPFIYIPDQCRDKEKLFQVLGGCKKLDFVLMFFSFFNQSDSLNVTDLAKLYTIAIDD
jgi:hypothetical protein